ncbi:hypothetical protein E2C01_073591 [Portunus trituberculatus]|uniref:Uncharacterized protein n=1 Tax=Portunus trituberculatus TaxID=210409 RepID=A0A5B7IAY3_PORTR|nr:hypothetical protein [Portunus trituberculatus]
MHYSRTEGGPLTFRTQHRPVREDTPHSIHIEDGFEISWEGPFHVLRLTMSVTQCPQGIWQVCSLPSRPNVVVEVIPLQSEPRSCRNSPHPPPAAGCEVTEPVSSIPCRDGKWSVASHPALHNR